VECVCGGFIPFIGGANAASLCASGGYRWGEGDTYALTGLRLSRGLSMLFSRGGRMVNIYKEKRRKGMV